MASTRTILPIKTMDAYQLASNEPLGTGSLNRIIEHLLKNDDLLKKEMEARGYSFVMQLWAQDAIYSKGDLVVYPHIRADDSVVVYILLCISDNAKKPAYVINDSQPDFSSTGWKLVHASTFYLHNDELLKANIVDGAVETAIEAHEKSFYHNETVINTTDDFSKLFLKEDISNFVSEKAKRDDTTADSIFNDGITSFSQKSGASYVASNSDKVVELELTFAFDTKANQDTEILNPRYFLEMNPVKDKSDNHIFSSYYMENTMKIKLEGNGITYENLRIPGTNIFSRTIEFPIEFANTEYMIFQSSYRPDQFIFAGSAAELKKKSAAGDQPFVSNILFMNKKPTSITAVLPIHSHFSAYGKYVVGVPWINEFKIRVIGFRK